MAPADSGPACEPSPEPRDPIVAPGPGLGGIDRTVDPSCTGAWIAGIQGRIADPSGAVIAGARTQPCVVPAGSNTLLCLAPPTTDTSGQFAMPIDEPLARCAERLTMRILLPSSEYATTYCDVALAPRDAVLEIEPIEIFPTQRTLCLPILGERSAPRTITLADGLELVDLRPEQITDYAQLAAGRHDLSGHCMVDAAPPGGFLGAYGFRPETDVLSGGVSVRIPNRSALASGSRVDLYLLGGLDTRLSDGTHVQEGAWARFGSGTVSADGSRIESDPDSKLTVLTWLAWRAAN